MPTAAKTKGRGGRKAKPKRVGAMGYATQRKPERTFSLTGQDLDFLDDVVSGHSVHDIESPAGSELATFIHNIGDADDRAEMLVLLLPIARRVFKQRQWTRPRHGNGTDKGKAHDRESQETAGVATEA